MDQIRNADNRRDPSTLGNPDEVTVEHVALDWHLDFARKVISGSVAISVRFLSSSRRVCLDSRDLDVARVTVDGGDLPYRLDQPSGALGSRITVTLPSDFAADTALVTLYYSTSPEASAVQWLAAAATTDKKHPFVFTQSQAIHARSLFPCIDSPGVKHTYSAVVRAPAWCTVLMSALAQGAPEVSAAGESVHSWTQPVPVAPYLIALAAGSLASKDISPRVRIWAEPAVVASAAYEFAQTETFLRTAEELTCPYAWRRYDVLCLPPSFPYGGMENPCLTFATPTLLAGDRSLADVIAHEIAHSWAGNLVTNHTWEHFWLNEGLTVWLERKITARTRGPAHFSLSAQIGQQHLLDDLARMGDASAYSRLVWLLEDGADPDDAFSSVPYEKGFNFLYFLEGQVGQIHFEAFIRAYIEKFKFGTVTSADFRDYFLKYFNGKNKSRPKLKALLRSDGFWDEAYYSPGMLRNMDCDFSNPLAAAAAALAARWAAAGSAATGEQQLSGFSAGDLEGWPTQQRCLFLERLIEHARGSAPPEPGLVVPVLQRMDALYGLSASGNAEIKFRWQSLCLQCRASFIVPAVIAFVTQQGRMKFVRPLYRLLYQVDPAAAVNTFRAFADSYHPIARKMVESDLKLGGADSTTAATTTADAVVASDTKPGQTDIAAPVESEPPRLEVSPVIEASAAATSTVTSTASDPSLAKQSPSPAAATLVERQDAAPGPAGSASTDGAQEGQPGASPSTLSSLGAAAVIGVALLGIAAFVLTRSRK